MYQKNFIELDRTFYQLSSDYAQSADTDAPDIREDLGLRIGNALDWDKLLAEYRVILLSEAGSGKTEEIRQTTLKLRSKEKPAFFIRLEHISNGLEGSFEEGSFEEFQAWLNSNDEGWLLLDSVDEARLKDPKDFERAIRTLASKISPAMQRIHIVITGRMNAWRPITDLALCEKQLPFILPNEKEKNRTNNEEDSYPICENLDGKSKLSDKEDKKENAGFKIYSLTDLSSDQVKIFVRGKGINNTSGFLDDIKRHDAWAYTTRPQDLEEIVEFWNENKRVGTRLELMQHSIERRLNERDQDRADSEPIAAKKIRNGARLIAAAASLIHESTIRVPDGSNNTQGINAKSILSDWNDKDCLTLLGRPIFDGAIYGSVRFHHRSVREYLTAEWLSEMFKEEGSRRNIENLFFREQYGIQVVTHSMKPILSWLVLFDEKIRQKVSSIEPEIIFEGGDPSQLPLETRREILTSVCSKIVSRSSSRSVTDYAAVQRFANTDMADDIKTLIQKYKDNIKITSFLLRMVWQGRIKKALPEARCFALNCQTDNYLRIAAIRAVKEVGARQDYYDILQSFISESEVLNRSQLAELIHGLEPTHDSVNWILKALKKTEHKKEFSFDGLSPALVNFVEKLDPSVIPILIKGILKLLNQKPVIEKSFCEISEEFSWLMNCSAKAVEKLISLHHSAALGSDSLSILIKIPIFEQYQDFECKSLTNIFPDLISAWSELNHCLFWKNVEETRKVLHQKKTDRLTNFWQASIFGQYWSFNKKDFELVKTDIAERELLDDRLVALSMAFQIYKDNNRPRQWRGQLKNIAKNEGELKNRLDELLRPPAQNEKLKKLKRQEAHWSHQDKEQKKKRQKLHNDWLNWLNENFEQLRDSDLLKEGKLSEAQWYLHEQMRKLKDDPMHWTAGDWRDLVQGFGEKTATAFRDGLIKYWRNYKPTLRSEKDTENNSTPLSVIFGLTGLEIESRETPDWPHGLDNREAEFACRYAFRELNGFPNWFPSLYEGFPSIVSSIVLKEIDWELKTENEKEEKHYVISKVSWNGQWLWDGIAVEMLQKLQDEPVNLQNLSNIIRIIKNNSVLSNEEIAELASSKCKTVSRLDHIAYWFATWIGVDPAPAIKSLSNRLNEIKDSDAAKNLAMNVIVNIVIERRPGSSAKEVLKTPEYLKKLYLLMHKYIKVEEDYDRSGKGGYTPELRDGAQKARDGLFSILKDIPGKDSYLALVELSKAHPVESYRSWMMLNAKERAEMDADLSPLSTKQFCEFSKSVEFTPTNHKELFELALLRLWDLKDDLEQGDSSNATLLIKIKEESVMRKYIGNWCRDKSTGKYSIPQEEELADAKKPDLRFHGSGFDAPVPVELKLADNWSGPDLFERLKNQLCGDYLRDNRSNRGVFLLAYRGEKSWWDIHHHDGNKKTNFDKLVESLQNYWGEISGDYPDIEQIKVIGIDLTKRKVDSGREEIDD